MIIWNAMDVIGLAILGIVGVIFLLSVMVTAIRIKFEEFKKRKRDK